MTELTNHKKRMIYDDACDILRKDAYGREDKVEEPEKVQIYDADWFASKFSLTKEEATSLLERLIKDEKLEEVEEDKYKAICRCSICGKKINSDLWEMQESHHIENYYGYESRYEDCYLDMDLCLECCDDLTDYLLFKARFKERNKCLRDFSWCYVTGRASDNEDDEEWSDEDYTIEDAKKDLERLKEAFEDECHFTGPNPDNDTGPDPDNDEEVVWSYDEYTKEELKEREEFSDAEIEDIIPF